MVGSCDIGRLPEICVAHVLSLTSPRDVCRSALVSSTFCSAASYDSVWRQFLPSDHREILSRAVDPVVFSSLRELYFRLGESILIDGGRKTFVLEKGSGAKCFTISARDLSIIWGNDGRYWRWRSHPDSRFLEVAELVSVCWLHISGVIDSRELSPNTTYKAYLIFKLTPNIRGLRRPTQQVSVRVGGHVLENDVCLRPVEEHVGGMRVEGVPRARSDGWLEIDMGEFFNEDGGDGEVSMAFSQVKHMNWKHGLIVEGIQVRPK